MKQNLSSSSITMSDLVRQTWAQCPDATNKQVIKTVNTLSPGLNQNSLYSAVCALKPRDKKKTTESVSITPTSNKMLPLYNAQGIVIGFVQQ